MNRRMTMAAPKMLGSRCREGGAENNRSRKRNFCHAEHFSSLPVERPDARALFDRKTCDFQIAGG
jgi:hypothetical protein